VVNDNELRQIQVVRNGSKFDLRANQFFRWKFDTPSTATRGKS